MGRDKFPPPMGHPFRFAPPMGYLGYQISGVPNNSWEEESFLLPWEEGN